MPQVRQGGAHAGRPGAAEGDSGMKPFAKTRARRAQEQRVIAIQAFCDHEWRLIDAFKGDEYKTFWCMMFRKATPTVFKYQCRKCEKLRFVKGPHHPLSSESWED